MVLRPLRRQVRRCFLIASLSVFHLLWAGLGTSWLMSDMPSRGHKTLVYVAGCLGPASKEWLLSRWRGMRLCNGLSMRAMELWAMVSGLPFDKR